MPTAVSAAATLAVPAAAVATVSARPRLSIGLPIYNEEPFIRAALDSLLAQDLGDFELIVSDNQSTDRTYEICQEYADRDPRVVLVRHERNVGAVENFRSVVRRARADYFMWAAADDRWSPRFARVLVAELDRHPEAGLAMSAVERHRDNGAPLDVVRFRGPDDPARRGHWGMVRAVTSPRKYNLFMYGVFRREVVAEVARSLPEVLGWDRHLMVHVALATRIRYVDDVLQVKLYRSANEDQIRKMDRRKFTGVHRRQLAAFARVIVGSRIVPWWRKAVLPAALLRYAAFILIKPYAPRAWLLVGRYLDSDGLYMSLSPLTRVAVVGLLLGSTALLGLVYWKGGLVPALLMGAIYGVGAACLAALGLMWRSHSALQQRLGALQKMSAKLGAALHQRTEVLQKGNARLHRTAERHAEAIRISLEDVREATRSSGEEVRELRTAVANAASQLESLEDLREATRSSGEDVRELRAAVANAASQLESLAAAGASGQLESRLQRIQGQLQGVVKRQRGTLTTVATLAREARYLTDLVVAERGTEPVVDKTSPLSRYAVQRWDKHRQVVEFARLFEASRIRELYLEQILPDVAPVEVPVGAINELTGHANKVDMLYVCAVARLRRARRIFEFGTYRGRTTYHLATPDAHVTTLNLHPDQAGRYGPFIGSYFNGTDREARITQIFSDAREFDPAPYRGQFELVLVDGDHSYEGVENDTRKAFELLAPGGTILWHDYAPKSIDLVRFFRDFTQEKPLFRIKRTSLLLHLDGVDPLAFTAPPVSDTLEQQAYDADPLFVEELYHV